MQIIFETFFADFHTLCMHLLKISRLDLLCFEDRYNLRSRGEDMCASQKCEMDPDKQKDFGSHENYFNSN